MDFSYEQIEQYLLDYEIEGSKIICEFQNENGEVFSATSNIKATKTVQSKVAKRAERMLKSSARRNAGRLVRTALGGGMLGRLGSSVARQTVNDVGSTSNKNYSESNIQEAVEKAFKRVSRNFGIGQKNPRSTGLPKSRERRNNVRRSARDERSALRTSEEMSYSEHIAQYPISNMFEQDIVSRIMVHMAGADGKITQDEREFIENILPKKFGTIAEIQSRGDISKIEAEEINEGIKKTIMLLTWSVALVDFELSNSESRMLNEYASLLGFDFHEAAAIEKMAKKETLMGIMEPYMDKNELFRLAEGLDIDQDQAERMFIEFKKSR